MRTWAPLLLLLLPAGASAIEVRSYGNTQCSGTPVATETHTSDKCEQHDRQAEMFFCEKQGNAPPHVYKNIYYAARGASVNADSCRGRGEYDEQLSVPSEKCIPGVNTSQYYDCSSGRALGGPSAAAAATVLAAVVAGAVLR